jgi:hypothetical protein
MIVKKGATSTSNCCKESAAMPDYVPAFSYQSCYQVGGSLGKRGRRQGCGMMRIGYWLKNK